jgi:hypothetical protein
MPDKSQPTMPSNEKSLSPDVKPVRPMLRPHTTGEASASCDAKTMASHILGNLTPAAFAANPHIVQPTRADFAPPVPLHYRKIQPNFPPSAVPRSTDAPSAEIPLRDPFSQDSHNGAFSTSLKGTRSLLRKRGRRAEIFVGNVDSKLRAWLGGEGWDLSNDIGTTWTVVDPEMVETESRSHVESSSRSRRMPEQHQLQGRVPEIPTDGGRVAAILELSRSPAHLTWAIAEGFERLIVHLLARYYDLISWSESTPLARSL